MPNTYQSTRWTGIQIDQIYPVGSLYFSVNNTDPGTLFGGVWQRIEDTFLLCAGSTYAAGTTGGAASVTSGGSSAANSGGPSTNTSGSTALTTNQIPSHSHEMPSWMWAVSKNGNTGNYQVPWQSGKTGNADTYNASKATQTQWVTNTGSGNGHTHTLSSHTHTIAHTHTVAIMPPYLAIYVWQRVE